MSRNLLSIVASCYKYGILYKERYIMMINETHLREELLKLMAKNLWNMSEVGTRSGLARQTISYFLHEKMKPTLITKMKLAKFIEKILVRIK